MADQKSSSFGDSYLWKLISFAGTAIMMNLLFIVCCIPVVTIGPACCGLFSSVRYYLRGDGWFRGFWKGFTTKWWQMMIFFTVGGALALFIADYLLQIVRTIINEGFLSSDLFTLIPVALILALVVAFITSVIVYNVFFPRRFIDLLSESAGFTFKVPLQLAVSGILFWAPPVAFIILFQYVAPFIAALVATDYVFLFIVILITVIAVYFAAVAFLAIGLLKDPLIAVLNKKRESGELPPLEKDED